MGGEGTRLRPITSRVPKPVAPLVERPFVAYILEDLVRHGVRRAIFSSGYLAEAIEAVIGDGADYGLRVDYVVESEPLGTAGAIANCEAALDDGSFFVFNGDVLTDVDLTAMAGFHREMGGAGTIFLTEVDAPRRYGLVELDESGGIVNFLEKPGEWTGRALINAGVYVLEPEVLDMIPRGQTFSIERGVFPVLAQAGKLFGHVDPGYWRDIGTPESYLQSHFDILERTIVTRVAEEESTEFVRIHPSAHVHPGARVVPPSYIAEDVRVEAGARVGPLAVIGARCVVGEAATVTESVLQSDVEIGPGAHIQASVIVRRSSVGAGTRVSNAVVGEGCTVGAGNTLAAGLCLFPDTALADNSIQFREQLQGREGI